MELHPPVHDRSALEARVAAMLNAHSNFLLLEFEQLTGGKRSNPRQVLLQRSSISIS